MAQRIRQTITGVFRRPPQLQALVIPPQPLRISSPAQFRHGLHPACCRLCGGLSGSSLEVFATCEHAHAHARSLSSRNRVAQLETLSSTNQGFPGSPTNSQPAETPHDWPGDSCKGRSKQSHSWRTANALTSANIFVNLIGPATDGQLSRFQRYLSKVRQLSSVAVAVAGSDVALDQSEGADPIAQPMRARRSRLPDGPSLADFILANRPRDRTESDDAELAVSEWPNAQEARGSVLGSRARLYPRKHADLRSAPAHHEGCQIDSTLEQNPGVQSDFVTSALTSYRDSEPSVAPAADRRVYFETYGCQMNVNDLEIVLSILATAGYRQRVDKPEDADVILINTCAIRENAESKVWHRLNYFKHLKQRWRGVQGGRQGGAAGKGPPPRVAVLGCMAERLKTKLLDADKMVDVVCGPDAYRDLPRLLSQVDTGQAGVNTLLSLEETYADVSPIRVAENSVSAFVSIMRGCDNMCSYCIVPFTRGRERSRPAASIVREVGELWEAGVREVVLLGQNVNSYRDHTATAGSWAEEGAKAADGALHADGTAGAGRAELGPWVTADRSASSLDSSQREEATGASPGGEGMGTDGSSLAGSPFWRDPSAESVAAQEMSQGFSTIYTPKTGGLRFAQLLDRLSQAFPDMRFRFTSPHPKDFPDALLFLMRDRPNVCASIHLPAQSGSTTVLERMRRGYSREAYLALVRRIRKIVPRAAITSDFIAGFCGETEEEHQDTLRLIEEVGYDMAYMFAYSMREKTHAHRRYVDDVPDDVKKRRLAEMIATFRRTTVQRYEDQHGQLQLVLVEGPNKRAPDSELWGRNDSGHRVMFPKWPVRDVSGQRLSSPTKWEAEDEGLDDVLRDEEAKVIPRPGDFVAVKITDSTAASLRGLPKYLTSVTCFSSQDESDLVTAAVA